jgi:hypothetical protein
MTSSFDIDAPGSAADRLRALHIFATEIIEIGAADIPVAFARLWWA